MAYDSAARHASIVVKRLGLRDYGDWTTPVYYYKRKQ